MTEQAPKQIPFSTLIAASGHDIKNILGSVMQSLDWLSDSLTSLSAEQKSEFDKVGELLANINSELMQLLCFFKFDNQQYAPMLREQAMDEFLEMQAAFIAPLIKNRNIDVEILCEEIEWVFDEPLMSSAIRNAILNAMKFTNKKIQLRAEATVEQLEIRIEDDGSGYPNSMLGKVENHVSTVDFNSGSTGLGLYFAEIVAKMHCNSAGQAGEVWLSNDSPLGGAVFKLIVPVMN